MSNNYSRFYLKTPHGLTVVSIFVYHWFPVTQYIFDEKGLCFVSSMLYFSMTLL